MNFINQSLLAFISMASLQASAQTLVNTTGNTIQNGSVQLEYSIGEIGIATISSPTNILTQGLLQPVGKLAVVGCPGIGPRQFFPNPTRSIAWLSANQPWISGYVVYAADGKLVGRRMGWTKMIDMTPYAAGVYFIRILPECTNRFETLKLIKL